VHRIVEGNGGTLRVESALGTGTTFRIALAQAEELE
jgi:signal transduction histidine kinase